MSDFLVLKNQILALIYNLWSWSSSLIIPPAPLVKDGDTKCYCVEITGPGGLDRLKLKDLDETNVICVGYNLRD